MFSFQFTDLEHLLFACIYFTLFILLEIPIFIFCFLVAEFKNTIIFILIFYHVNLLLNSITILEMSYDVLQR